MSHLTSFYWHIKVGGMKLLYSYNVQTFSFRGCPNYSSNHQPTYTGQQIPSDFRLLSAQYKMDPDITFPDWLHVTYISPRTRTSTVQFKVFNSVILSSI